MENEIKVSAINIVSAINPNGSKRDPVKTNMPIRFNKIGECVICELKTNRVVFIPVPYLISIAPIPETV